MKKLIRELRLVLCDEILNFALFVTPDGEEKVYLLNHLLDYFRWSLAKNASNRNEGRI